MLIIDSARASRKTCDDLFCEGGPGEKLDKKAGEKVVEGVGVVVGSWDINRQALMTIVFSSQ